MAMLFFYVRFILKLTLVAGQYYVLKGREAILTPSLTKDPDDILWKHNGDKVITFDTAEERVFGSYQGRVTLAWKTAELKIADARYEDSGEYELDVFIRDRPHSSQFMLKVLDKVSVPVIRCEMNDESGDSNNRSATLFCSSESDTPEALTFKWNLDGKSHLGQTLPIALGNEQDDVTYSCTATNPLQEENSSFMAKDCYTERTAQPVNRVLPILIPLLIVLAFVILGFVFRHKLKTACSKREKNDDIENQPNAAGQNRAEDERDPLMERDLHRQETILSPQRLPKQEYVDEAPQGKVKDVRKIFENCGTTGTYTGKPASPSRREPKPAPFPGRRVSGEERGLPNQELNNVSNSEEAGDADSNHSELDEFKDAQEGDPASPSRREPKPAPFPGQRVSGEERGLPNQELNNVSNSEEAGDADSNHSELDEFKDAQAELSPTSETEVNQHLEEQKSSGTTDSEMKSDEHHKDHDDDDDDEQERDAADPSSSRQSDLDESTEAPELKVLQPQLQKQSSDENVQPTNKEQDGLTEQAKPDHKVDKEPQKDSTDEPVLTPPATASEQTESLQSPQSSAPPVHAVEPESKEQTNADEESNTDTVKMVSSNDLSNKESEEYKDAQEEQSPSSETKVNQDLEPTPEEQKSSGTTESEKKSDERHKDHEDDEQEKDAAGPSTSIQSGPDESTKAPEQPVEPESKEQTNPDEESNTGTGKRVSSSDLSNKESVTSDNKEVEESGQPNDSHMSRSRDPQSPKSEPEESRGPADSEKKSDERHKDNEDDEQEKDAAGLSSSIQSGPDESTKAPEQPGSGEQANESTLPPASSSSQRADNKQTKGTDGELTEEDNSLHDGNQRRD